MQRHIADTMTSEELWAANQKFLDRVITRGDNVRLSTNAFSQNAKQGKYLQREIDYLLQHGYRITDDGWWIIKVQQ
jgi:hypothetical protein